MNNYENFEKKTQKLFSLQAIEYGENPFKSEDMNLVTQKMIEEYKDYFLNKGYLELDPVKISSGIDSSVRFIGSHISPMKPYFLMGNIPEEGLIMSQPCIRTRNISKMFDDEFIPNWGSYFKSLGALVKPEQMIKIFHESIDYLLNIVGIPVDRLVLRVNTQDEDLYRLINEFKDQIEIEENAMPESYYRHKIGVDGVYGRNFNYALKTDKELSDIGNLIVLENGKHKLGVELALGTSTILKEYLGLDHVNSANPVALLDTIDSKFKHKFEDSIITSVILLHEGLRPGASDNKTRILRSYIRGIIYFKNKLGLSDEDVMNFIVDYEKSQHIGDEASVFLKEYIPDEESSIRDKNDRTKEEEEIYSSINVK